MIFCYEWGDCVIHANPYTILFLKRDFMSWTHTKKSSIALFAIVAKYGPFALWRHHSWSVKSGECEVLALWRHIRQLFLRSEIGVKLIFSSK